jgi:dUTP pyrophosphatase
MKNQKNKVEEEQGSKHCVAYDVENNPHCGVFMRVINKSPNELPTRATEGSAAMDVRAWCENDDFMADGAEWDEESKCVRIFSGGRALIHTGLYYEIPKGYVMQVCSRSGLAIKNGIQVLNAPGLLDSDYRGELGIILINLSNEPFEVHTGDRVAQIMITKCENIEQKEVSELSETDRADGGFGHSGIK